MGITNDGRIRMERARQAGARIGQAVARRSMPKASKSSSSETAKRFKTLGDLRAPRQRRLDEQRLFEALWARDAVTLDTLQQDRVTPGSICDWAEQRWYGSPEYQTIFKSSDQFVEFVTRMCA
jgi:hypothetical protein